MCLAFCTGTVESAFSPSAATATAEGGGEEAVEDEGADVDAAAGSSQRGPQRGLSARLKGFFTVG